jgi:hypothetical protein
VRVRAALMNRFQRAVWVLPPCGDLSVPQVALEDAEVTAAFSRESDTRPRELKGFAGSNTYFGHWKTNLHQG